MATYWHPLLAQFLREDYGDRLEVKDSVKIGKMPLELDILIFPNVSGMFHFSQKITENRQESSRIHEFTNDEASYGVEMNCLILR